MRGFASTGSSRLPSISSRAGSRRCAVSGPTSSRPSRPSRRKADAVVPGDQAKVSLLVRVPPAEAFRIFTEEIDGWWRSGRKYRIGKDRSVVHLEPRLGGRLFERFAAPSGTEKVVQTGVVTAWEPPARVVFSWRAASFRADETSEVEVQFEPTRSGTNVT